MTAITARLLAEAGATVDLEHTIVVHQIWDNQVRASVSIPPTAEVLDCTFRIYRKQRTTFEDLVEWDSLTPAAANVCKAFAMGKTRMVAAGEPGSGKSTYMAAHIAATPSTTNVRISQKYRELTTDQHLGGNWLAGPANKSMRDLTQAQLNFAPGLVVVAECLGPEAFDLIRAANSGCAFITSVHSFSATEAMNALPVAAKQAVNDPVEELRRTFARLIDVVVYCEALPVHLVGDSGRLRQIMEIACVPPQLSDDEFVLEPLFKREELGAPLEYCGPQALTPEFERRINRALPQGRHPAGPVRGEGHAAVTVLIALVAAVAAFLLVTGLTRAPDNGAAPALAASGAAPGPTSRCGCARPASRCHRRATGRPSPGRWRRRSSSATRLTGTLALACGSGVGGRVRPTDLLPAPATQGAGGPHGGVARRHP